MLIKCPKCRREYDPETQASSCDIKRIALRHHPIVKTAQKLPATLEGRPKKPKRKGYQPDFQLIWDDNDKRSR